MENMNLLDLDNDILNIIGDYVKKDNHDRLKKREEVIRNSIKLFEILKKSFVITSASVHLMLICIILRVDESNYIIIY